MASEFLNDEELNEVSGGKKEYEGEYLYKFEPGDWVYARADMTVVHRVTKAAQSKSPLKLVNVEVQSNGIQPAFVRVQAKVLLQYYRQFGGKLSHYEQ